MTLWQLTSLSIAVFCFTDTFEDTSRILIWNWKEGSLAYVSNLHFVRFSLRLEDSGTLPPGGRINSASWETLFAISSTCENGAIQLFRFLPSSTFWQPARHVATLHFPPISGRTIVSTVTLLVGSVLTHVLVVSVMERIVHETRFSGALMSSQALLRTLRTDAKQFLAIIEKFLAIYYGTIRGRVASPCVR